jgi:hypothetical protein
MVFTMNPNRNLSKQVLRCLAIAGLCGLGLLTGTSARAAIWYVDNAATGANNGTSWANAWSSFSSVVWGTSGVKAGDTLYISGGSTSKTYTETWTVGASGTAGSPIRIAIDAANPSHNGTVIFDYNYAGDQGSLTAITCLRNYITFDGSVGSECHIAINNLRNYMNRMVAIGIYADSSVGVVIDHIASTNCNNPIRIASATGFRVSNCNLRQVRGDACIAAAGSSGSWDANLVYSNFCEVLYNGAVPPGKTSVYVGADGVQCTSGLSIFGNKFLVTKTSVYTSDQHPDMVQAVGYYLKIYGNEFNNIGDSAIDYGCYSGNSNPHDVWIYNNVFRITASIDPYPEFFRFYGYGLAVASISNFKILNNTFIDNNFQYRVVRFDTFGGNPTASGNEIKNNLFYNCGGGNAAAPVVYIDPSSSFTSSSFAIDGNVYCQTNTANYVYIMGTNYSTASWVSGHEPHGSTGVPKLVSYTPFAASGNDFHLQATDTVAKDKGVSLSSYFTTDKDGVARPQGPAWDIGAYEYASGGGGSSNLPPVVSAVSVNATDVDPIASGIQVFEGTTVQYSGSASDPNGDALTWQWIYTINGGAEVVFQSGAGSVLPISFTYPTGSGGNTYVWTLRVSDGQLTSQSQLTIGVETPPAAQGLTFPVSAGVISAPFVLANNYISQSVQTTVPTNGGRAAFNLTITNAGYYVIQGLVNAPDASANSLYVNIDAEPQDPLMIWDIVMTSGFEQRLASWRGTGTDTSDQFVPKVFNLAAGAHQVIFRGREANVQLQSFSLLQVPTAPQNLRVLTNLVTSPTFSAGQ